MTYFTASCSVPLFVLVSVTRRFSHHHNYPHSINFPFIAVHVHKSNHHRVNNPFISINYLDNLLENKLEKRRTQIHASKIT